MDSSVVVCLDCGFSYDLGGCALGVSLHTLPAMCSGVCTYVRTCESTACQACVVYQRWLK